MVERTTKKDVVFLVCTKWPLCRVSGTPELLERVQVPMEQPEPVPLGKFIVKVAQLRIHQSKLKAANTAEEREAVRKQAEESMSTRLNHRLPEANA